MANLLGDLQSKIAGGAKGTPDDTLKLSVSGKTYEGWNQITLKRSIKAISGTFDISVIDRWAEEQVPWPISPGIECTVSIGGEILITGYVDSVGSKFDSNSRGMSVSGRDRTADMVDCAADHKPGNWASISLFNLAKKLAAPFKVAVSVDPTAQKAASQILHGVVIQNSETAFECLDRNAKLCGVLLSSDGMGGIRITRPGTDRSDTQLVQGENLLSCEADFSQKERFSKYIVKSQDGGLDGADPSIDLSCKGIATDPTITRYRPIIIVAEGAATAAVCRARAQWEASVRIGKSTNVKCKVPGWRQGNGKLWAPNQIVKLIAPWVGLDIELLITEVSYKKDNDGTTTDLSLEPVAAYQPDPTLITRKEPWAQLVAQNQKKKVKKP